MKFELQPELIEILEDNGFAVRTVKEQHDGSICVELNQHTPLGEDWWVCLVFDKPVNEHQTLDELFITEFENYTDNFDVDEEAAILIECRGQYGVPTSITDLVEDAQWKNQTLLDTLYDLKHDPDDEEVEETEVELWKVFSVDGKEICSYTIFGEGRGEELATINLLAAERGLSPGDIEVYVEER